MTEFNKRFRQMRETLKLSQVEFAKRLKITQITVSRYENENKNISSDILERIAQLGISLDWLLLGTGTMFGHHQQGDLKKKVIEGSGLLKSLAEMNHQELTILYKIHAGKLSSIELQKLEEIIDRTLEVIRDGGSVTIS